MRLGPLSGREVLHRLLLVTAGIAAPLLLLEAAVHVVEAARGPVFPGGTRTLSFSHPDPALGWRHASDFSQRYGWPEHPDGYLTIVTNGQGLREDAPTPAEPEPHVRRALALGDSHTDGLVNNDESWPNVAERAATDAGAAWEVLNAGVTGYQPVHYDLWWRTHGRALRPELVLLGYYLGNDLHTGAERAGTGGDDGPPAAEAGAEGAVVASAGQERGPLGRVWVALRHRCRLCALTSMIAHRTVLDGPTYEESLFIRGADPEDRGRYLAAIRHCLGCVWQSLEQRWRVDGAPGSYGRELESTERVLRALRDDVRDAQARLVVVVIPSRLQIEPEAVGVAEETADLLGVGSVFPLLEDRLEADLRDLLERLRIPYVEVREALSAEHRRTGAPVYYAADWHLNVAGSRVVGETVEARVLAGLEPEAAP